MVVNSHGDGDIPIFERQFLGGARDVRGFEFRDLGPQDAEGSMPPMKFLVVPLVSLPRSS